ncbi:MAG: type II secretion system GspH family protein [Betaproteobacteria bacterium]|nr:type II secretion system GspH family protein [Betaproteobacteria bacterium]MCL2885996.1 type II secretion system GspH family protein [Betaproteobacteria bacterium]
MRPVPRIRAAAGFSLIELAIVLVIVALLAGGLMMTLSTQQEIQRLSEVRRQLADIREALLGFAIINGRLPAPADPSIASGTAGAGESDDKLIGGANKGFGVLPWTTLGLPETDPWGQRFTYKVSDDFATSDFMLMTPGSITVTDGAVNIATNLPAIVISHGRNGLGGYDRYGQIRGGALGDEKLNASNTATFVSRTQAPDFDDEVIWIPLPILMSRMLTAGRLP